MVAALTIDEAAFCSNMMLELGFDGSFGGVPSCIDNTLALHVAGNRTCSPLAKHVVLRYFSCKNWWRRARSALTTSIAKISWQTWARSTLANTVTATSSSLSTSLRLKTPTSSPTTRGGRSSYFCARNTCVLLMMFSALCSLYRGTCTLHTALLFRSR